MICTKKWATLGQYNPLMDLSHYLVNLRHCVLGTGVVVVTLLYKTMNGILYKKDSQI